MCASADLKTIQNKFEVLSKRHKHELESKPHWEAPNVVRRPRAVVLSGIRFISHTFLKKNYLFFMFDFKIQAKKGMKKGVNCEGTNFSKKCAKKRQKCKKLV